jgi:hypothetical protein
VRTSISKPIDNLMPFVAIISTSWSSGRPIRIGGRSSSWSQLNVSTEHAERQTRTLFVRLWTEALALLVKMQVLQSTCRRDHLHCHSWCHECEHEEIRIGLRSRGATR